MKTHKLPLLAAMLFVVMSASGCTVSLSNPPVNLVWPIPPEEMKIAFVNSYRGDIDLKRYTYLDLFLGVEHKVQIQKPYGVASWGDKIYVALSQSASVIILDTKEKKVGFLDDSGQGKLSVPIGLAISSSGIIYVSDAKRKRVFGYNLSSGGLRVAIGNKGEFENPSGLAVNDDLKRLYVVDSYAHSISAYSLQGEFLFKFGSRGDGPSEFNYPSNVAVDRRNGTVHVVDTQNFRVQIFDKDGKFIRMFGYLGDGPGAFSRPKGIGVDSEGNTYVVDAAFGNFQIFNDEGQLLLVVGNIGAGPGEFQLPAGLFIDDQDRIFVTDQYNARVQVFQYLSDKWKKDHPEAYEKLRLPVDKPLEKNEASSEIKKVEQE